MNEIRLATIHEYEQVRSFYHQLIDEMKDFPYDIGWKKDIYPTPEFLMESIQNNQLYIGLENNQIISSMVLNHQCNEGYSQCDWKVKTDNEKVTVIHALGVLPAYGGKGVAKQMVSKAMELAKQTNQQALRLDILSKNIPAEKLYTSIGFEYRDTVSMYYEDTGWTEFKLYEWIL